MTHSCTRDCSPESRRPPELLRKIIWQTYWEAKSCHGAALVVFTLVQSLKWCVYVRTYNICTSYRGLHMFVWKNAIKSLRLIVCVILSHMYWSQFHPISLYTGFVWFLSPNFTVPFTQHDCPHRGPKNLASCSQLWPSDLVNSSSFC